MRQSRNALERWKSNGPMHPQAAANNTAAAGDASATKNATSIGPRMKIISMTTDSSEYAADSIASSFRRCLKKVRMHTVIGGKKAPEAKAAANAGHSGTGCPSAATK